MRRNLIVTICAAVMLSIGLPAMASAQARTRGRTPVVAHDRFNDQDRQAARNWYDEHQKTLPLGLRNNDRWPPDVEGRIQEGFVFDNGMRRQFHSVPPGLLRMLGRAPRGDRYVMANGHILLIDRRNRVVDVIHLGHGG